MDVYLDVRFKCTEITTDFRNLIYICITFRNLFINFHLSNVTG